MIFLYTDGGCQKQLKTGFLRKLGAWAYLISEGTQRSHAHGTAMSTSDNVMALTAVNEGLRAVTVPSNIQIIVNSEYLMNGITIWLYTWKNNGWKTRDNEPVANREHWEALEKAIEFHKQVTVKHVDSRTGGSENGFVGKLCQLAIAEVMSGM